MLASTRTLFLLIAVATLTATALPTENIFAQTGGSTYRAMVYAQTEERIKMLNELYGEYYTSAHNQFSHLTPEEFAATYLGGSMSEEGSVSRMHVAAPTKEQRQTLNSKNQFDDLKFAAGALINDIVPSVFSIDYTQSNNLLVTPVKHQGLCGSCWAFAGVAGLESYFMKKHNLWLDLSEQQMVDCLPAVQTGNLGCGGGLADSVDYYATLYPIAQEKYYPYLSSDGNARTCSQAQINEGPTFKINSYVYIYDCVTLASALLALHPIVICGAIDSQWQNYAGGVLQTCNVGKISGHCVLLVGAVSDGTSAPLTNYWKIKNSWGATYGENGFMRLYRDPNVKSGGFCQLCGSAVYPV